MPLLDHFHAPLYPQRAWESFHSRWANSIADALNGSLPERFVAEVQLHLGTQVETDVAEFALSADTAEDSGNGKAVAVVSRTWAPPAAVWTMPAEFPDDLEVQVRDQRDDARLVAVVELVSPRNKDRPESRRAFAAKCAAYLQRGIGLIIVDVVTGRRFNLHNEMVQLLILGEAFLMPADATLYAVAYAPRRVQNSNHVDVWPIEQAVGNTLPTLPLALRGFGIVPLDLESTYQDARKRSRL